jgi:hypothetical protein
VYASIKLHIREVLCAVEIDLTHLIILNQGVKAAHAQRLIHHLIYERIRVILRGALK